MTLPLKPNGMRITRSNPNNAPPPATTSGPDATHTRAQPVAAATAPADGVQLSALSDYLASALSGSPAREAKLTQIGTAVSSGQYRVDAYIVSGSIIQHSIEFGGSAYQGLSTPR